MRLLILLRGIFLSALIWTNLVLWRDNFSSINFRYFKNPPHHGMHSKLSHQNLSKSGLGNWTSSVSWFPRTCKYLIQPLDLSTNGSGKKMKKRAFSDCFISWITAEMMRAWPRERSDYNWDWLKLSTRKTRHR